MRPAIVDLEVAVDTLERIAGVTAAPVLVVLNGCPARGRDPDDAAAALAEQGADVCEVRVGQRVVFGRALIDGRTAQEVEPGGRAAREILELWRVCTLRAASTPAQ